MTLSRPAQGHVAMLTFSALVAGSFSLGARIANDIDPTALTAARFLLTMLILGVVAAVTGNMTRAAARSPWRYVILGALFAVYFVLMFEGLKTAPPVSASAVFTLTPVMAGGFGWLFMRQITTARMALALAVGATGALWVIFRADPSALLALEIGRGEAIFFVGCIAHAAYAALIPALNRGESPIVFTFGMLVAGFVLLAAAGWRDIAATDWANLPAPVWITLGYLTVFASAVTLVLLQFASLRLPAAKVMAYTYLIPTWVILWEVALGRAAPPAMVLVGIGLTVVALMLLLREEEAHRTA